MSQKIGKRIKEVLQSKQIRIADFAERIGVARQNIYRIFEKENINTDLLAKISAELDYDFFQDVRPELLIGLKNETNEEALQKIESMSLELFQTKKELELALKEIDYLKKIISLMEERTNLLLSKNGHDKDLKATRGGAE